MKKTRPFASALIKRYLTLQVKQVLDLDVILTGNYVTTRNIVSNKVIIVPSVSDKLQINNEVKIFIESEIKRFNRRHLTRCELIKELLYFSPKTISYYSLHAAESNNQ